MTSNSPGIAGDDDRLLEALVSAAASALKIDSDGSAAVRRAEEKGKDSGRRQRDAAPPMVLGPPALEELRHHARRLLPGQWRPPYGAGGEDDVDVDVDFDVSELVASAVDIARKQLLTEQRNGGDGNHADDSHSQHVKKHKAAAPAPAPAAAATFSLLDHFNAKLLGGGGLGLVTAEQILEAETPHDQLALLRQVQELDEEDWLQQDGGERGGFGDGGVAPAGGSWERVLDAIRRGIVASERPCGQPEDVAMDYAQLLEKWVDLAGHRGGQAFGGGGGPVGVLQLDLVQLAIDVVASRANDLRLNESLSESVPPSHGAVVCAENSGLPRATAEPQSSSSPAPSPSFCDMERTIMTSLLRCVWRTWMDWMMLAESRIVAGNEERVHAIGSKLWVAASPSGGNRSTNLLPSILASLDPCALWFSSWMSLRAGYPAKDWLYVMVGTERPLENLARQLVSLKADLAPGKGDVPLICCYWPSITHSLLEHLRVSMFPWRGLMVNATADNAAALADDDEEEEERVITWLLELYLLVLNQLHVPRPQSIHDGNGEVDSRSQVLSLEGESTWKVRMQEICFDTISILLSGCRTRRWYSNMTRMVHGAAKAVDTNQKLQALVSSLHLSQE